MLRFFFILHLMYLVYHTVSSRVRLWNHSDLHQSSEANHAYSPGKEDPRVLRGEPVSIKSFPFAVSMLIKRPYQKWAYHCGGCLISRTAVLTAAHCVMYYPSLTGLRCFKKKKFNYSIVAGTDNIWKHSKFKQSSYVKSIFIHPYCHFYTNTIPAFDSSVVTVRHAFDYSERVRPMKLFSDDFEINSKEFDRLAKAKTVCYVVGYGETSWGTDGEMSNVMRVGELTLMTNEDCKKLKCAIDKTFCYINFMGNAWSCGSTSRSSPCRGDSGGPFVCNGLVFGTVSWGLGCFSSVINPAFFTNTVALTYMVNKYGNTKNYYHIPQSDERREEDPTNAAVRIRLRFPYYMVALATSLIFESWGKLIYF